MDNKLQCFKLNRANQILSGNLSKLFLNIENISPNVTLVSDDLTQFQAHKIVLGACSPVLKNLLLTNPHSHPLLFLRGVKQQELESLLQFMYLGETVIHAGHIHTVFDIAKDLQMQELAQDLEPKDEAIENDNHTAVGSTDLVTEQDYTP